MQAIAALFRSIKEIQIITDHCGQFKRWIHWTPKEDTELGWSASAGLLPYLAVVSLVSLSQSTCTGFLFSPLLFSRCLSVPSKDIQKEISPVGAESGVGGKVPISLGRGISAAM